jgi:hypothetical protein
MNMKEELETLENLPAGIEAHYSAGRLCIGRPGIYGQTPFLFLMA